MKLWFLKNREGIMHPSMSISDEVMEEMSNMRVAGKHPVKPFMKKTFDLVSNPRTDPLISWNEFGDKFVVNDPIKFSMELLPSYFKHRNLTSFIRQLNAYGFKKTSYSKMEFCHMFFRRNQEHLLKNIERKPKKPLPSCVGCSELRQAHELFLKGLQAMEERVQVVEEKLHEITALIIGKEGAIEEAGLQVTPLGAAAEAQLVKEADGAGKLEQPQTAVGETCCSSTWGMTELWETLLGVPMEDEDSKIECWW